MGAPIIRYGTKKTSKIDVDKKWLEQQYFGLKKSIEQIAIENGISKHTLFVKFKAHGFKARPLSEARAISQRVKIRRGPAHEWWKGGIRNREGYIQIKLRDHPDADRFGYVFYHRLIAEIKIRRPIQSNEHVHHIDGDKTNNCFRNLEVLDKKAHRSLHMTEQQRLRRTK